MLRSTMRSAQGWRNPWQATQPVPHVTCRTQGWHLDLHQPLGAPGATDPRRGMQQVPDVAATPVLEGGGSSSISAEAHAGFAHVAQMLTDQVSVVVQC